MQIGPRHRLSRPSRFLHAGPTRLLFWQPHGAPIRIPKLFKGIPIRSHKGNAGFQFGYSTSPVMPGTLGYGTFPRSPEPFGYGVSPLLPENVWLRYLCWRSTNASKATLCFDHIRPGIRLTPQQVGEPLKTSSHAQPDSKSPDWKHVFCLLNLTNKGKQPTYFGVQYHCSMHSQTAPITLKVACQVIPGEDRHPITGEASVTITD